MSRAMILSMVPSGEDGENGVEDVLSGTMIRINNSNGGNCGLWKMMEQDRAPTPPPAGASSIAALSAGDGHILALNTDCEVLSWGTGNRGQCGRAVVQDTF